ncbi:MAG: N-acetylmuramoyl-L-alanine amidase [Lachnospiraceae bacterium]|nr:N-acetylmuramoyl-L-alanine amidase [Lachnospiraceae bacterium]
MAKKICLDAGHYGKINVCPAIPEYYESERMWDLHLLLKKKLEAYGFEVITTRADQTVDKALTQRGKMAAGCDLFISMHSNATYNYQMDETVDYVVAIVALDGSADEIGGKLAQVVAETMGVTEGSHIFKRYYDEENKNLDYYGVIRGAVSVGVPAMLLEHSFHTNTRMVRWLLDDQNLDKLAQAEADLIAEYFGINIPAEYDPWTAKVVNTEALNVRRTPNAEIIKEIYSITVIGEEPDSDGDIWYKVRLGDGTIGYLWPEYLER